MIKAYKQVELPNFDRKPSVMDTSEVSIIFNEIMDVLAENKEYQVQDVVDIMTEGISSIGYDPKGRYEEEVIKKVIAWVDSNWSVDEPELFEGLATVAIEVLNYRDFKPYLLDKIKTEKREFALTVLKEIADENAIEY